MIKNESDELIKTMLKCGLQLLMLATGIALIVGIVTLCINYSANIGSFILTINNLFLPSKHFIQDNIWIFLAVWVSILLWLICVFVKTPAKNIESCKILTKILSVLLIVGTILMLCIADMNDSGFSGGLFFFTALFVIASVWTIYSLTGLIAEQEHKLIKENNKI